MQTLFFKLIIKTQVPKAMEKPRDENPITKLWHQLATNNWMLIHPSKFMKFAKLVIVQIISNVEDEKTLSTLTFNKFKLWKWLVKHLNITIHMFAQGFFVNYIFPFQNIIIDYNDDDKVGIKMNA